MTEIFTPDNLFAGNVMPVVTDKVIIASGNNLTRATVVGLVTASGKAVALDSTKEDGSQNPYGILCDNVDATSADQVATVYLTGEFNEGALVFSGTDTADTHRMALRKLGIFVKKTVKA